MAEYDNNNTHLLTTDLLNVTVYEKVNVVEESSEYHEISIRSGSLAGSSCNDLLMTVGLKDACAAGTDVEPPLHLDLPTPVSLTGSLTQTTLGAPNSFVSSFALDNPTPTQGSIQSVSLSMDDGTSLAVSSTDPRLSLSSLDTNCLQVSGASTYAAQENFGACGETKIRIHFHLRGSDELTYDVIVYPASGNLQVSVSRYPSPTLNTCSESSITLKPMGCTSVMQRARFEATYTWTSNGGESQSGTIDLDHSDVNIISNLDSVPLQSTGIMTGSTDLDGFYKVVVFEQNATEYITVLSSTPATLALSTLDLPSDTVTGTSVELQLGMTADGCLEYAHSRARVGVGSIGNLGNSLPGHGTHPISERGKCGSIGCFPDRPRDHPFQGRRPSGHLLVFVAAFDQKLLSQSSRRARIGHGFQSRSASAAFGLHFGSGSSV